MARVTMVVLNDFLNDARVAKQAETLTSAGHDVTVLAVFYPGLTQRRERKQAGYDVVRASGYLPGTYQLIKMWENTVETSVAKFSRPLAEVIRILRRLWFYLVVYVTTMWHVLRLPAVVIEAHDINALPIAYLAARLKKARLVYDSHEISWDRHGYTGISGFIKVVEGYLIRRVDVAFTTTETRAELIAKQYNVPKPDILQNRMRFQNVAASDRIRDRLRLDPVKPIVLYQGVLQPGRGLERLVDVAAVVPNANFVYIGAGTLEGKLKEKVKNLGLAERVHFIPKVPLDELMSYTASADIGLQLLENTCLNHSSAISNKVFEYLMAGVPVIASDFPEIRKVLTAAGFGLLVDSRSVEDIAAKIKQLVENEALRKQMKESARLAAKDWSWEAQEDVLLRAFSGQMG